MINFEHKVAAITGGTSGIGLATALLFAKLGAQVAVCSSSAARVAEAQAKFAEQGAQVLVRQVDVADEAALHGFIDETAAHFGGLDILVNNAGYMKRGYLMEQTRADWDKIMNINLVPVWQGAQAAAPHLAKRGGGAIVNTSSFASLLPSAISSTYAISKVAVNMVTKVLASELASRHIRVNAVAPGVIDTDIMRPEFARIGEETFAKRTVMRRTGRVEEVANCIAFLASDLSSYITGEIIDISGGKFIVQDMDNSWK